MFFTVRKEIEGIKEWMDRLTDRLMRIDTGVENLLILAQNKSDATKVTQDINENLKETFDPNNEVSSINRIHEKLDELRYDQIRYDQRRCKQVSLAEKTLEKFEDYMKNVDKLHMMINEFKGCVSIARSALNERKQLDNPEKKKSPRNKKPVIEKETVIKKKK